MIKKYVSIETKLDIASGALQATAEKLEEVTKDTDIKCAQIDDRIAELEQQIVYLENEKANTERLRSKAYRQMCNINKLLEGDI